MLQVESTAQDYQFQLQLLLISLMQNMIMQNMTCTQYFISGIHSFLLLSNVAILT